MDLQSALVCVLVFVVSAALLLLISMFGMREKSYEEALAEQRQLTSGLLGSGQRSKPKEKKQKKTGKKVKEKPATTENNSDTVDESESVDVPEVTSARSSSPSKLHHVEFEEPAAVVADSTTAQPANTKKRNKKDKVKPILLNKEKTPVSDVDSSKIPVVNHFEKIHPKDEFELMHSHKEDIPVKQEKQDVEAKAIKSKTKQVEKEATEQQQKTKTGNKDKKQSQQQQQSVPKEQQQAAVAEEEKVPVVEQPVVAKSAPVVQSTVSNNVTNTVKDKKKKKSEFNTLQQMTVSDKHDVNVSLLVPLVRKADLSRSEIQILIDLLLNKQHEAPAVIDEWSEGRTDPVQKLKRQLAEKERALTEEQEALVSAQAKLREVRAELNSERSRLLQNYRNLEENFHAKHTELQTVAARMHTQNQKMQQMQAQINEEVMTSHKLREELSAMQLQRQQLDIHLNQKQETEASIQTQLSQLRSELQEQQNMNGQLNMELRNVRETSLAEKEMLHDRIRQIETQAVHFKNESDQCQEFARQLEESRRTCNELEHRRHITETELTVRYQQQLDEVMRLEAGQAKANDEVGKLQAEVARLNHMHKQQQDDHRRFVTDLQSQISTLQNEKTHLEAANEAADDKNKEIEILNLQNELASFRVRLQQRENQLSAEIEEANTHSRDIEAELKTQREKNDELRKKNWKMMEALNSAETILHCKKQSVTVSDDANLKKLKFDEQDKSRKFLQRLFPEIKLSNSENWMTEAESAIKEHINELEREKEDNNIDSSGDIARLQSQVVHYRNIIEDTEGMLNKLQSHVEREETNWRKQIQAKDEEIDTLREQHKLQHGTSHQRCIAGNSSPDEHGVKFAFNCIERSLPLITEELQTKISELEESLQSAQQAKQDLQSECESLKTRLNSIGPVTHAKHTQLGNGDFNGIEKVLEEKNRLAEQLVNEQKRIKELTEENLRLKSTEVSVPTKVVQNHTSNGTALESAELPNSASSSSVSPTTIKPRKNKKKKAAISN